MGPAVIPKKTKFRKKPRNFNKRTECVLYYLIPDSKTSKKHKDRLQYFEGDKSGKAFDPK